MKIEYIYKDQTKFREYWKDLSDQQQKRLSTMNNRELFRCRTCDVKMILAAIGSKKRRPYFRAKNSHLDDCDWEKKEGKDNRVTNFRDYSVQESLDKTFSRMINDFDEETTKPEVDKSKTSTVSNNPTGSNSEQTSGKILRAKKLPEIIDDINIGKKYFYRGTALINYFSHEASTNEYIYLDIKGLIIRIKKSSKYFNYLSGLLKNKIDKAMVNVVLVILPEEKGKYYKKEGEYINVWADYQIRIHAYTPK